MLKEFIEHIQKSTQPIIQQVDGFLLLPETIPETRHIGGSGLIVDLPEEPRR